MKMKLYLLFLLMMPEIVYSQNEFGDINSIANHYDKLFKYIENPSACDTLCIKDLFLAQQDVDSGYLTFCKPIGLDYGFFRFDNEIENACKSFGLRFKVIPESDDIIECQAQGCYGAYMDKLIRAKYGKDINKRIYLLADSLFVNKIKDSNSFVSDYECDKKPKLLENEYMENSIYVTIPSSDVLLLSPNSTAPEITYLVKIDSFGRSIYSSPIINENFDYIASSYRKKLYDIAEKRISQLKWTPAQLLNYNINCRTRLTIRFKN